MTERTRGYVKVAATGRARFFRPCAGRWTGGSVEVSVTAAPGWYRAVCEFTDSGPFVELGRCVDPVAEAYRLNDLGAQTSRARTRKPGVAGYQHMEDMANAALDARRQAQRHFARVLLSDGAASRRRDPSA